jgi:drug/metabolite transporter (DMT)-like permease
MTAVALGLVLTSAVIHATWNLLAKRSAGGAPFIWLVMAIGVVAYAPVALVVAVTQRPHVGGIQLVFIAGSAVLQVAYFLFLQRGYRAGDLSLVYPLARGTGPLLATAAAIVLYGERPTPIALCGVALIGVGVFILTGGPAELMRSGSRAAVAFALLTGTTIAAYTLWDKYAVSVLAVPPVLYYWADILGQMVLLTPIALRYRKGVRTEWRTHGREALGVGLLSPLSYILVLTALVFSRVSYVAPAREVSILLGAILGSRLLTEGREARRLAAAGTIMLGVVALAVG